MLEKTEMEKWRKGEMNRNETEKEKCTLLSVVIVGVIVIVVDIG